VAGWDLCAAGVSLEQTVRKRTRPPWTARIYRGGTPASHRVIRPANSSADDVAEAPSFRMTSAPLGPASRIGKLAQDSSFIFFFSFRPVYVGPLSTGESGALAISPWSGRASHDPASFGVPAQEPQATEKIKAAGVVGAAYGNQPAFRCSNDTDTGAVAR